MAIPYLYSVDQQEESVDLKNSNERVELKMELNRR